VKARHFLSLSAPVLSPQAQGLQRSLASQAGLPVPTSIYVGMQKGGRFPPTVLKNEASRRGAANNFLSLNPM